MDVYAIASSAHRALHEAARKAQKAMNEGTCRDGIWFPVSLEEARKMYWREAHAILREAHVQVDPDAPIAIQCSECRRVTTGISRQTKTFRCHCSPYIEQWVCKSRTIDQGSTP